MTPAHIILARLLASKSVRRHDRRAVGRLPLPPLSRDHIESAQAIRRLKFAGVRVIGVSDGVEETPTRAANVVHVLAGQRRISCCAASSVDVLG